MSRATANFLAAWGALGSRQPVALVRFDLVGSTLYAATDAIMTPPVGGFAAGAGQTWEPLVNSGTISNKTALMNTGLAMPSATLTLNDRTTTLAGGRALSVAMAAHEFRDAPVTIWLWERSLADFADAFQRFTGTVQTYSSVTNQVVFQLSADMAWNASITPVTITRPAFPQSPDASVGSALGTFYGKVDGVPLRLPLPSEYGPLARSRECIAGGKRIATAILVDTGRGGATANPPAKVMVAAHPVKSLGCVSPGYTGPSQFVQGKDGTTHALELASADIFNASDGAGFYVRDNVTAHCPVPPARTLTGGEIGAGHVDNANALLDPFSEYNFARVDSGGRTIGDGLGQQVSLYSYFDSPSNHGTITGCEVRCVYRTSATVQNAQVWFFGKDPGFSGPVQGATLPTSTSVVEYSFTLGPTQLATIAGWDFSQAQAVVGFLPLESPTVFEDDGNPAVGWVDVFWVGLSPLYTPQQDVVTQDKVLTTVVVPRDAGNSGANIVNTYQPRGLNSNVTELTGKFFSNVEGWADADGSATGTVGALIEVPCDVVRHMLAHYGGVASGDFVTAAGATGSFTDARALLSTWCATSMVLGFGFSAAMQIGTLLSWIMAASASDVWQDETTGAWCFKPWLPNPPLTYRALKKLDLMDPTQGPKLDTTPSADVLSAVSVQYGYDDASSSYLHTVAASATSSVAGHLYHAMRDGGPFTVVTGANDALDWTTAAGTVSSFTLDAGTFTPDAAVTMLAAKLGTGWAAAYGGRVVQGVNDSFVWGGRTVTVPPGDYTMESLALAAATAAQAMALSGAQVFFNRASLGFTFYLPGGGTFDPSKAAALFGFSRAARPFGISWTGPGTCEEQRFRISSGSPGSVLAFRTGTHGLLGTKTCAWELLGFDWQADAAGGADAYGMAFAADCPRTFVEASLTGSKVPVQVDGRCLYDTRTALETRNRVVDIMGISRGQVTTSTETCPDLGRGDVFPFDAEVDGLRAYAKGGTSGSWAGRAFQVIETQGHIGDAWHQDIVAVDMTQ